MKVRAALFAVILLLGSKAEAQPVVSLVTLLAVKDAGGWHIDGEVEGTGLTSAAFVPPGRPALDLPCESGPGVILCEREEPSPPAPGFESLAALLVDFPAGNWQLSVNGGVRTATLPFDPESPDGFVTVTNPADGATHVSSTPTVTYQNACATCPFLEFRIEDAATVGDALEIDALITGPPPLPSGQLDFADFFDAAPTPLLVGDYRLIAGAGNGSLDTRAFDQGVGPAFEFQYGRGAELQSHSSFSVPEPAGAALAACSALLALARRRRARWASRSSAQRAR